MAAPGSPLSHASRRPRRRRRKLKAVNEILLRFLNITENFLVIFCSDLQFFLVCA
uniref:Uncharacterized protein n=1 Tax=Setaria italica TaxID=4555 RepID=K3ZG76_SETIT